MKELLNNLNGLPVTPKTLFEIKRINNQIIFQFKAYDSTLESYSNKDNDDLWKGNVVEIFLQFDNNDKYLEIEIAPSGAIFSAYILNRKIEYIDHGFIEYKIKIENGNYFVDAVIDLSPFSSPKEIKYNAFRIENQNEKTLEALFPTYCDTFHVIEKFKLL